MRNTGPSRTALSAAVHRAAHQVLDRGRVFADPLAVPILSTDAEVLIEQARAQPERGAMRAFIAARHRFAMDAQAERLRTGTTQVVVLGASLDTTAYRHRTGAVGVRFFEVDHPTTQQWKRERLVAAGIAAPERLTFVPTDFETQHLLDALVRGGFDPRAAGFFSWLGVVPYLTREAVFDTLRTIAGIPGSAVVFDYSNPVESLAPELRSRHRERADRVRSVGEPWLTYFDTAAMHSELDRIGLSVLDDLGPDEIRSRYFGLPADAGRRAGGHVVLASCPERG